MADAGEIARLLRGGTLRALLVGASAPMVPPPMKEPVRSPPTNVSSRAGRRDLPLRKPLLPYTADGGPFPASGRCLP